MKKILIIGASILQLPAIEKAKKNGYYTIVVDYNPNAVGVALADEFHAISTIDTEAIVELAKRLRPDGVMTLATDMPMRSVAAVGEELGLPCISSKTAILATDKGEMIKAFEAANVEHPWYYIIEQREELTQILPLISYPCVIKPTDNAGNRGVCYIDNKESLIEQSEYSFQNSRSGHIIIEEYMVGDEVSVEIIVLDGCVHILAITDKVTLGKPYFVEVGHSQPSRHTPKEIEQIKDLATRAVLSLGINNSPAHVEIMLTQGGPKMVELGARMGGGCITTHLVPLSTGIDMLQCSMDIAMGIKPDLTPCLSKGSALRHITGLSGVIHSIEGVEEALKTSQIKEVTMLKNIGDTVGYFKNGNDRIGYVIAQGDNAREAISHCEKALKKIHIKVC